MGFIWIISNSFEWIAMGENVISRLYPDWSIEGGGGDDGGEAMGRGAGGQVPGCRGPGPTEVLSGSGMLDTDTAKWTRWDQWTRI